MPTDDLAVDVSQDGLQACSVQERFMRGSAGDHCNADQSAMAMPLSQNYGRAAKIMAARRREGA